MRSSARRRAGARSAQGSTDPSQPAAAGSTRATRSGTALLALLAATLVVKAIVLAQLHGHPLLQPQGGLDSELYVALARRVAAGDLLLGPGPYFVSPLYVYFLGLAFALAGGSLLAAQTSQIVLGTAAVALVFLSARHWYGDRPALLAGALATATGVFTFHEVVLLQSALDPFLCSLSLWLLARALARGGRSFVAAGLAFGVFALNRPNVLAVAAALAALLAVRRPWRAGLVRAAALAAGVVLAIAPVTLRNVIVSGEPILISSHGGLNFYIGNNPEADGTYRAVPGITPNIAGQASDTQRVAEREAGRPLSAREASRHFTRKAWRWIAAEPTAALRLLLHKLVYTFNEADIALNYSYRYYSRDEATLLRLLLVGPWLLVPLGVAGLLFGPRREQPGFAVWAAFAPAYALSVAAFFVSSRYRLPLLVPLCVGGAGAFELARAARAQPSRRLAAAAVVGLIGAALANWPLGLDEGRAGEGTEMIVWLADQGRVSEARARLERVAPTHPQPAVLFYRVGQALLQRGDTAAALELLERARGQDPGLPEIGQALGELARVKEARGVALAQQGRASEAVRELEEAARLDPQSASARLNLAVVYAQEGRRERALALVEEALRLRPGYPQAVGLRDALARGR